MRKILNQAREDDGKIGATEIVARITQGQKHGRRPVPQREARFWTWLAGLSRVVSQCCCGGHTRKVAYGSRWPHLAAGTLERIQAIFIGLRALERTSSSGRRRDSSG